MEINEELQGKIMQFQQLQQQIQVIANQKYQVEMQVSEIGRTVEELDKLDKKAPIYKSVGSLLVGVKSKEDLKKELDEKKETLEIRLKTLGNQEKSLMDRYKEIHEELNNALGGSKPQAG